VWAVSLWGTHLNLPQVCFKRCGGSKQAVLREKLAHKADDNIGLSQTTQSIEIIISHRGGSCSECWFARQLGDRVTTWLFDKSNGVCFMQRWLVYSAVVFWIVPRQGHLVLVTVSFTILFVPITAMCWPSFENLLLVWPTYCSWHITQVAT